MKKLLLSAAALAIASSTAATVAHADVLFLDFNYSTAEVNAAKLAAQQRGEKFLVIPANLTPAMRSEINSLQAKRLGANESYERLATQLAAATDPNRRTQIITLANAEVAKSNDYDAQIHKIANGNTITAAALLQVADQENQDGRQITSLVISGHSNGTSFWGDASTVSNQVADDGTVAAEPDSLQYDQVSAIFKQGPALQSVRSLFLWGCYGQTDYNSSVWKVTFPTIQLFAGFSDEGPLGSTAASPALLHDLLVKEKSIAKDTEAHQILRDYSSLADVHYTHLALSIGQQYTDGKHVQGVDDLMNCAKKAGDLLDKSGTVYNAYFNVADTAHQDVPSDPHHSDLRDFYTDLQQNRQCVQANPNFVIPSIESTLALIFFSNVKQNYCAYYKDDFKRLAGLANALTPADANGVGVDPYPTDCSTVNWTRTQWITFASDVAKAMKASAQNSQADATITQDFIRLRNSVVMLRCNPATWVTDLPAPGEKPATPAASCMDVDSK